MRFLFYGIFKDPGFLAKNFPEACVLGPAKIPGVAYQTEGGDALRLIATSHRLLGKWIDVEGYNLTVEATLVELPDETAKQRKRIAELVAIELKADYVMRYSDRHNAFYFEYRIKPPEYNKWVPAQRKGE